MVILMEIQGAPEGFPRISKATCHTALAPKAKKERKMAARRAAEGRKTPEVNAFSSYGATGFPFSRVHFPGWVAASLASPGTISYHDLSRIFHIFYDFIFRKNALILDIFDKKFSIFSALFLEK